MLTKSKPEEAKKLLAQASEDALRQWKYLEQLAAMSYEVPAPMKAE